MAGMSEAQQQEEAREENDDEEESEEAQTMWQAAFTFLPVLSSLIWTFAMEAIEAGTCQLIMLVALPVWASLKALFGIIEEPDPCDLDPNCTNPPPPPSEPNMQVVITTWMEEFAETKPVTYLVFIFGIAFLICLFWLFLKDITDWMERRKAAKRRAELAANKYRPLDEDEEAGGDEAEEDGSGKQASAADLTRELRAVTAECDMLELKAGQYAKSTSEAAHAMRAEIADRKARLDELRQIVHGVANAVKAAPKRAAPSAKADAALAAIQQEAPVKEPSMINKIMKSALMKTVIRSAGGIMAISIYFADIISDVQVLTLLWDTKNYLWAFESLFLLIAQFLVVYLRAIPYLYSTFGGDSTLTQTFLWFGFPTGLLLLDGLMFLEPFGLLSVLPFPEWLRQFVPAYKATRIIAEVVIESLPQCVLQAFIYVVVIKHTQAGTATASEAALFEFCSLLPKSILISVVAMVKTCTPAGLDPPTSSRIVLPDPPACC